LEVVSRFSEGQKRFVSGFEWTSKTIKFCIWHGSSIGGIGGNRGIGVCEYGRGEAVSAIVIQTDWLPVKYFDKSRAAKS
jgi:hypothetical protein